MRRNRSARPRAGVNPKESVSPNFLWRAAPLCLAPPLCLALLCLLSGAAALAVEIVWLRWLRVLLGATAPAVAATLTACFLGHAAGAAWAARRSVSWHRSLKAYGVIELAAAVLSGCVPLLLNVSENALRWNYDALLAHPNLLAGARFAAALLPLLPASFAFGASFPALANACLPELRQLGRGGTALYTVNTLGGAVGAALVTFGLLEWLGVPATYSVAVAASAAAGSGALILQQRMSRAALTTATAKETVKPRPVETWTAVHSGSSSRSTLFHSAPLRPALFFSALSGFGVFALQVLLVQAFAQVLNQSVYAFGAVLVAVLSTLALGASIAAYAARRGPIHRQLPAVFAVTALSLAGFPLLFLAATRGLYYQSGAESAWSYILSAQARVILTAGLPLLSAGLVFPLCLDLAAYSNREPASNAIGSTTGRLLASNTLGAVAGALATPFLLLPYAGLWRACFWLAAAYALGGAVAACGRRRTHWVLALGFGSGLLLVAAVRDPLDLPVVHLAPGEKLLAAETSAAGVVAVIERSNGRVLRTDNHYNLGGSAQRVQQERMGHLPLLLARRAERVVHLGSATGISASAVLEHGVGHLVLVEIMPAVARAAARYFRAENKGIYEHPRSAVVLDDARNFFRFTSQSFDVVIADLFVPWHAGTGSLYTREHFAAVRRRLRPGGLFCQWLPLYQLSDSELDIVAATFLSVFPKSSVFRGDFYGGYPVAAFVGFADQAPAREVITAATQRLRETGARDRWLVHPLGPWALYVGPLAARTAQLAEVPLNSDADPQIEYRAARRRSGTPVTNEAEPVGLRWPHWTQPLSAAVANGNDVLSAGAPSELLNAIAGGAALQQAGGYYVEGQTAAATKAFAEASRRLPPALVKHAAADATAAEIWSTENRKGSSANQRQENNRATE